MRSEASIEARAGVQVPVALEPEAGFEAVFRQHERAVFGWILRLTHDRATAEDLTIETFWRVYQARARYDPSRAFEPWVRRIATRLALDWLRSRRPETLAPEEFFTRIATRSNVEPLMAAETRGRIVAAFHRLPTKLRVAAQLALIEERPYREVADALDISVTAVKVRIFRAVRLLRGDLIRWGIRP